MLSTFSYDLLSGCKVLFTKVQVGDANESCCATVTKRSVRKLSLCHDCEITWLAAFQQRQKPASFPWLPYRERSKQGDECLGWSVAHGSIWTVQYRNGQKQREGRGREGRESPECKAMFRRNVLPPVLSCNWTGNSPESCLTQAEREGGCVENKMDLEEGDGWRTGNIAQVTRDNCSRLQNLKLCIPSSIGWYDDMWYTARRYTFFRCHRFCSEISYRGPFHVNVFGWAVWGHRKLRLQINEQDCTVAILDFYWISFSISASMWKSTFIFSVI